VLDRLALALRDVEKKLLERMGKREEIIKKSRDVLSACSKAMVRIHSGKMKEAREELDGARKILLLIQGSIDENLQRYIIPPEQEYAEAEIVYSLASGGKIPLPAEISVSHESYILGLLDSIGELKRLALSCMMKDNIEQAKKYFSSMEKLYSLCSPFAVYDNVLPGTRRKIDIARMIVEDTRGILAEELSRRRLKSSVEKLRRKLSF
jgi:translin